MRRLRSSANMINFLLEKVLTGVFTEHKSADGVLTALFRQDRRIGSKDRKLYGAVIFSVLRWYGPLHRAFSGEENALHFYAAGGTAAEGLSEELISCLLQERVEISSFSLSGETAREHLESFLAFFGKDPVKKEELFGKVFYDHLPFEVDDSFCSIMQTRPPLWLRCRNGKREEILSSLAQMGYETMCHPAVETALAVTGEKRINLPEWDLYKKGIVEVQDLSSHAIGLSAGTEAGEHWWDCCAGGGGKTLLLGSLVGKNGSVTASDIREWKLPELLHRAKRASLHNVKTCVWNGSILPEGFEKAFDGVLVDAPCSSSGRWRRNPEGRYLLTEEELLSITQTQYSILCSAAGAVKHHGVLLYGTCSFFREEDESIVQRFLAEHDDFILEDFPHPLTGEPTGGLMRVIPSPDLDCDGAFAARLRRK